MNLKYFTKFCISIIVCFVGYCSNGAKADSAKVDPMLVEINYKYNIKNNDSGIEASLKVIQNGHVVVKWYDAVEGHLLERNVIVSPRRMTRFYEDVIKNGILKLEDNSGGGANGPPPARIEVLTAGRSVIHYLGENNKMPEALHNTLLSFANECKILPGETKQISLKEWF